METREQPSVAGQVLNQLRIEAIARLRAEDGVVDPLPFNLPSCEAVDAPHEIINGLETFHVSINIDASVRVQHFVPQQVRTELMKARWEHLLCAVIEILIDELMSV